MDVRDWPIVLHASSRPVLQSHRRQLRNRNPLRAFGAMIPGNAASNRLFLLHIGRNRRGNVARRTLTPFVDELRAMASEDRGMVDPADRPILRELANDPTIEQIWYAIEKSCGLQRRVVRRSFIRSLLGARQHAMNTNAWPDYLTNAKKIEDVTDLLKSFQRVPFMAVVGEISGVVTALESIASRLRDLNTLRRVRISRQNVAGSRQVNLFIQLMSIEMIGLFGRPFDSQVAELTNILFPSAETTKDSVRSARQPTARKSRTRKC